VKSVLGEFSSGVSICRNKGTQSDLGSPFLPGAPRLGGTGSPSSGSALTASLKKGVRSDRLIFFDERMSSRLKKFDHCSICRQCSLSICRSRLSKVANPLLKIAFSRFCRSEFVYDTGSGSVYFT